MQASGLKLTLMLTLTRLSSVNDYLYHWSDQRKVDVESLLTTMFLYLLISLAAAGQNM